MAVETERLQAWLAVVDNNPEFFKQLGRRIAALRRAVDLTQEKLGERAGVEPSYVAHIETGKGRPTIKVLLRIADAVNAPLWRLLTDDRITVDEKAWDVASRDLAAEVKGLPQGDLQVLSYLASRLKVTAPPLKLSPPITLATRAAEARQPMSRRPRKSGPRRWRRER